MAVILFVWDFHGTLEKNNVKAVQKLINKVLPLFGVDRSMTLKEASELYGLSWIDYCKYAYPEGTLAIWQQMKKKLEEIQMAEKTVERYIEPMDHSTEVLKEIKHRGHVNIILSNTAPKWIKYFVKIVGLGRFIDDYLALDRHDTSRGQADIDQVKYNELKRYLADRQFSKIVKIGDRASDIEAGKLVGAVTYFFRNQFNKRVRLKIKPDYDISDLRKVLQEL